MTSRERVLAALALQASDRTPRDFQAEDPAWVRLLAHAGHRDRERLLRDLGIDMQHLLPHGSPAEVRAEARRYCDALGQNGGYIPAPAHRFQPDVPPVNILALYAD